MRDEREKQNVGVMMIGAALAHIVERGHLHDFRMPIAEKQALMRMAIYDGLIRWDTQFQRYKLTARGREGIE
jgi:hypothetical protein